jgi:hypothetical protein
VLDSVVNPLHYETMGLSKAYKCWPTPTFLTDRA